MAIKTTMTEVNQIIKEEFARLMEKNNIKKRIKQINEELSTMEEEDDNLGEVKATGIEKVRSHAWTGKEDGDDKFGAEFEKKGSHLLEDEEELEVEETEDGADLSDEFAELGAAIEAKIKAALGGSETEVEDDSTEDEDAEEFEEVEVLDADEDGIEMSDEDTEEEEEEEEEDKMMAESTKKTKKVITENKTKSKYLNILSEGLDKNQKSALQSEVDRMRKLAKLGNND